MNIYLKKDISTFSEEELKNYFGLNKLPTFDEEETTVLFDYYSDFKPEFLKYNLGKLTLNNLCKVFEMTNGKFKQFTFDKECAIAVLKNSTSIPSQFLFIFNELDIPVEYYIEYGEHLPLSRAERLNNINSEFVIKYFDKLDISSLCYSDGFNNNILDEIKSSIDVFAEIGLLVFDIRNKIKQEFCYINESTHKKLIELFNDKVLPVQEIYDTLYALKGDRKYSRIGIDDSCVVLSNLLKQHIYTINFNQLDDLRITDYDIWQLIMKPRIIAIKNSSEVGE